MTTASFPGLVRAAAASAAIALFCLVLPPPVHARESSFAQLQQGKELVAVGDCEGCHTAQGGRKFAGGRALHTPFGTIYSPNITPDPATGIGSWTEAQFYRAMHDGIDSKGNHLYPAFPYPWFTKVSRQDVDAIYAYLRTLPPVRNRRPGNTLPWPLDERMSMAVWNTFYFDKGAYKPDPKHSKQWNRGAYLVRGLGHCGACHTPENFLGAAEGGRRLEGGVLDHWYAPSLNGEPNIGLGGWTKQQIVEFLQTGATKKHIAYGPMGEVVHYSTSKISKKDLDAIADYLKSLPAAQTEQAAGKPSAATAAAGRALYVDSCSECHGGGGQGVADLFPALKGSPIVQAADSTTIIRLILSGGHAVATDQRPTGVAMPSFGWKLSNREVADVASYVRSAWGNKGGSVSASKVRSVRDAVQTASSSD